MDIFSEIYGLYYRIVQEVLCKAPLNKEQARRLISESGYAESLLHLAPSLLEPGGWRLLEERGGLLHSRLAHPPRMPVSLLERRWLKSVLADPRARLFLPDEEIRRLEDELFCLEPLYDPATFRVFDRYSDGDDYYSHSYIQNFRAILAALRGQSILGIAFYTGAHGGAAREVVGSFLPIKLEYSQQDDKFRVYCAHIRYGKLVRYATINLGRVIAVRPSRERYTGPLDPDSWFTGGRCAEPVVVEVSQERNTAERFLLEFSSYEKETEPASEQQRLRVSVWYTQADETALLIKILSFGPTVRILEPNRFVELAKARIDAQCRLLQAAEQES